MRKYYAISEAEWVRPAPIGYRLACCDCGLVHRLEFAIGPKPHGRRGLAVMFRAWRDNRATAQIRRHKRRRKDGIFRALGLDALIRATVSKS